MKPPLFFILTFYLILYIMDYQERKDTMDYTNYSNATTAFGNIVTLPTIDLKDASNLLHEIEHNVDATVLDVEKLLTDLEKFRETIGELRSRISTIIT